MNNFSWAPKLKEYVGNDGQWMAVPFSFVKGTNNTTLCLIPGAIWRFCLQKEAVIYFKNLYFTHNHRHVLKIKGGSIIYWGEDIGMTNRFWKLLICYSQSEMLFNAFYIIWKYALVFKWCHIQNWAIFSGKNPMNYY